VTSTDFVVAIAPREGEVVTACAGGGVEVRIDVSVLAADWTSSPHPSALTLQLG
jgi:hypothetical protein